MHESGSLDNSCEELRIILVLFPVNEKKWMVLPISSTFKYLEHH